MIKDDTLQDALTFLFRNTSGHTSQDGNLFLSSEEHHTFFGQPISPTTTVVGDVKNSSLTVRRRLKWRVASEYMALGD